MDIIIASILVLLGANIFIAPLIEQSNLYFPNKEIDQTPQSIGLDYEDVYLESKNGKTINGWYLDNKDSEKVILYFHGNGGNISGWLEVIPTLYALPADVFMIDYQGYGKSEGHPSRDNCYADARAAYQYLVRQKNYAPEQIFPFGYSLGGPIAAHLASEDKVGGLILEDTFTSTKDIANLSRPLYKPFLWMMKQNFDTMESIDKINTPLLIIHRKTDEMIPYAMAEQLYAKAQEPKTLLLLEAGGHNDFMATEEYMESLRQFLLSKKISGEVAGRH